MKKPLVIGCLGVVLLLMVAGGGVVWSFGRPYVETFLAVRQLGKLEDLNAGVRNRSAFAPPAGGVLAAAQVERYLSANERILGSLEGGARELSARFEEIDASARGREFAELATAWREIIDLVMAAKRAQVDALNAAGFSLGEYAWVRQQVFQAAGLPVVQVDLAGAIGGSGSAVMREAGAEAPAENRALVEPHRARLEQLAPLAAFGL